MDIQKDALEMQIAFEKNCAKSCGVSYEDLKAELDHQESIWGTRYLETSPRHEKWLVWSEAWQQAQKVDATTLQENKNTFIWNGKHIEICGSNIFFVVDYNEEFDSLESAIEKAEAK